MPLLQKIIAKKEKVDIAITKEARLEGQIENQMSILKSQYNCDTIKEAKDMISKLVKRAEQKEKEIKAGLKKLEEDYPFD